MLINILNCNYHSPVVPVYRFISGNYFIVCSRQVSFLAEPEMYDILSLSNYYIKE